MAFFEALANERIAHRSATSAFQALVLTGLMLVALLPRVYGLDDFLTTDEAYHWIDRTAAFSAALASGDWAATNRTGHPGVTLMWLGSLGLALERAVVAYGWSAPPTALVHLAWLRLPAALLETLLVPLAYLLLRRLVAPAPALLAAFLWATSPYLIAHSRLLHLDALLTAFVTLSLLLLLVSTTSHSSPVGAGVARSTGRRALIGSGACAGLALLTKGPALILLPVAGLVLALDVTVAFVARGAGQRTFAQLRSSIQQLLWRYLVWLAVAAVVVLLLWPALWTDPTAALGRYIEEITLNGGRPNGDGQFFLGRAVDDPGALFYPLANLFRMTPLMLFGMLGLPFALWRLLRHGQHALVEWDKQRRTILALGVFILFWTLVMTLGPKKFDRYVLPTWPALLVFAALGLHFWMVECGVWLRRFGAQIKLQRLKPMLQAITLALLATFELAQPLMIHPYYLSYYNPLLGGGALAQRVFLIGWGEGMDQVAAALRARPDLAQGPVLSALGATLQPLLPVPVRDVTRLGQTTANYAVVYLEAIQRAANPQIYRAIQESVPIQRITINGIDYATIHQLPKPFERLIDARFGALRLRGVTVKHAAGQLIVTPSWDVRERPPADYLLFLHLLDAHGRRVAQVDLSPGGGDAPATSAWQPGQQIAVPIGIGLPDGLPAGVYELALGLYDQASGARLPFMGGMPASAGAGPDALLIDRVRLP